MPENQDKEFTLISVQTEEEDDLVIQAGFIGGSPTESEHSAPVSPSTEGLTAPENTGHAQERQLVHEMLTTEEDLHAKIPYANMQRVILIVFVLFLIVALLYWFLLR